VKPCVFHPEADEEFAAAVAHYAAKQSELGQQFYEEVMLITREIAEAPGRFREWRHGTRRHFRRRFPYALIYAERPDRVLILAVAHFKRRPDYWRKRTSPP
jgi:toxin ParE1/3/4